jgi:hypothetical protein
MDPVRGVSRTAGKSAGNQYPLFQTAGGHLHKVCRSNERWSSGGGFQIELCQRSALLCLRANRRTRHGLRRSQGRHDQEEHHAETQPALSGCEVVLLGMGCLFQRRKPMSQKVAAHLARLSEDDPDLLRMNTSARGDGSIETQHVPEAIYTGMPSTMDCAAVG